MGRAGKDDLHLRQAPLTAVVHEAAEPHASRGKTIHFETSGANDRPPLIKRQPEVIHGIRNLVQNAVDFAASDIWIETGWDADHITLRIVDNGDGFPPQLIGRIGDPFVRGRKVAAESDQRPEYQGMGLGLFIAKTLLERTGAKLTFANGHDPYLQGPDRPVRGGAIVVVVWPRSLIEHRLAEGLGENRPIAP
jgi:two-component system, sensor histidine kinase RegB